MVSNLLYYVILFFKITHVTVSYLYPYLYSCLCSCILELYDTFTQSWQPPSGLMYKLNFDAAVFANREASSVGAVICNEKGEVMAALSAKGSAVDDSEEAEVLVC